MPNYNVSDRSVAYVRDRIQSLMSSTIAIYTHGENVMDGNGIITYQLRNPVYTGKARVWQQNTGATMVAGESVITMMQTNISIPFGSYQPNKDDVVVVIDCPPDTSLNDRAFRVVAVDGSGQMGAVHRMTVTSFTDSAVWET